MGKRGNQKNTKQAATPNSLRAVNIVLPEKMSAEEMRRIITAAIVESERQKRVEEEKERERIFQQWKKDMGQKDFSHLKNHSIKKFFCSFWNDVVVLKNILFAPHEKVKGDAATVAMLKFILEFIFFLIQMAILLLVLVIVYLAIIQFRKVSLSFTEIMSAIGLLFMGIFLFLFSTFFRLARIESDKIDDRGYLLNLCAAIASFISMIIAVIAVVKGA